MISGLIQAFGGEIVFLAWHFLWAMYSIVCYKFVCWVFDSKILTKIWKWIRNIALAILVYKEKNGRK